MLARVFAHTRVDRYEHRSYISFSLPPSHWLFLFRNTTPALPDVLTSSAPVGLIVGGAAGGLLLLVAAVVLAVLFKTNRLKLWACCGICSCCEPRTLVSPDPVPPVADGSAPPALKRHPVAYSSAAVAHPPPPAYRGPDNLPVPGAQTYQYPVPVATAAPPPYRGPVHHQYPAPL